ncbi:MAG: ParB/RepB/Spo0J family partition protein [Clostridia bacterium]|nr:ParB/RepB/Spo0J family partition protein [Clostridia bacterium]
MKKKSGLGKGLAALLQDINHEENFLEEQDANLVREPVSVSKVGDGIDQIPIDDIIPNPDQPRKKFDETALLELSDSIRIHGVIQPIVVTPKDGKYMIIAGERRYRASKLAKLTTMPAVVRRYSESQIKEIALIENLQREDLNPIEAAMGIKQLMDEYKCTQEAVAERIGKSRPAVTNYLRLLTLTDPVIELVKQNRLSAGHAKCLVSVTDPDAQLKFAKSASDGKMSVRDIEKAVRVYLNPEKYAKKNPPISIELRELINDMQHVFATKVKAIGNDRKGRIYIDYYTKDDLDRIHTLIARIKK